MPRVTRWVEYDYLGFIYGYEYKAWEDDETPGGLTVQREKPQAKEGGDGAGEDVRADIRDEA
jgi:hypothetical protein